MRIKIVPDNKTQETLRPVSPASRNTKRLQIRHMLLLLGARFFLLLLLLVGWQFSSTYINPIFLSSPLAIWQQTVAWMSDGSLWFHTEITLQETLLGLFFGVIAGILVGFLFGMAPWLAELLDPLVIGLYSIPKVALAPLFILWFGIDIQMKIIFTAITVFFLVFLNTHAGVRNVDPDLINAVLLMGGKRRAILLKVIVPSSIGHILTGLRTAIPYALIGPSSLS